MKKIVTIQQVVDMIQDGDEILFNAFGSMGFPEEIVIALGQKFDQVGHPCDLKYITGAGQGVWNETDMIEHISKEGMVSKVTSSHFVPMRNISRLLNENKIEAYNIPLGIYSHLVRSSASRKPGVLSKVGVKTFIDPRIGGGAMNQVSKKSIAEVMTIDGEEYLFYKALKPTVTLLKGTSVDCNGNVTMEKEAILGDPYECAMCAKAWGGRVIVQVERVLGNQSNHRLVKIPSALIDAIVVVPTQKQSFVEQYNPAMSGEWIVPEDQVQAQLDRIMELNAKATGSTSKSRGVEHEIIARRAALELDDNYVVNLGIGIPEQVPLAAQGINPVNNLTLTVEAGTIRGYAVGGVCFGAGINTEVLQEQGKQFDFYDGGGLDATFVGAMQVDPVGNVNVSKSGKNVIGVGGFINLTVAAKKVIFCFPFSGGGTQLQLEEGKLTIVQEGRYVKFKQAVEQISFSGESASTTGQKILYVTERAVFQLTTEGIMLTEIAPGINLEQDILSKMEFTPLISPELKEMDAKIFNLT